MKIAVAFAIASCPGAVAQEPWTRAVGATEIPASFGSTVDGIGDANRDGIPDIAVGMFGSGAWIYSGANGERLLTANRPTGSGRAEFGFRVARAGDVDGDGCADVAVSAVAPREWNGYVSLVSAATGKDIALLRSEVPGDGFGISIATGDIDDDGKPEIVVGAPHDCFAGECAGAVYVFSGATHKLQQLLRGRGPGSHFGTTLLVARDLEADPRQVDLLIASREEVAVFAGRSGRELRSIPGSSISIATCGDIDGDTRPQGPAPDVGCDERTRHDGAGGILSWLPHANDGTRFHAPHRPKFSERPGRGVFRVLKMRLPAN